MKQFTYKDYDIATGIVFTNLCCDMLSDYIGNNIEIKEEYNE